jgi:hypothetical protein
MNRRIFLKRCLSSSLMLTQSLGAFGKQAEPKRIAVVIGIDNYLYGYQHLTCAADDAGRLAGLLTESLKYEVKTFIARERISVTKQEVFAAIQDVVRSAQKDDTLLFYFGGHGASRGGKQFLLFSDTDPSRFEETALSFDEIKELLSTCLATKRIFIMDACRTTQAGVPRPGRPGFEGEKLALLFRQELRSTILAGPQGVPISGGVLFSCGANQAAIEPPSGNDNSPFVHAILSALGGGGGIMGAVTLKGLLDFININLPDDIKKIQQPEIDGDATLQIGSLPRSILLYHGPSADVWMHKAVSQFNAHNINNDQIRMERVASRSGKQEILYNKAFPVMWNPADIYWASKLDRDWQNPKVGKHTTSVIANNQPILKTALVLVMHGDRAEVFKAAMKGKYKDKTWQLLYDLAERGWTFIGGQQNWNKLKIAQSDPTQSNSGLTALSLMFAEYQNTHKGATTNSPEFTKWMQVIERAVPKFVDTTSLTIERLQDPKENYDIAISYEQNVFSALKKGAKDLHVIYPEPTVFIEYPMVTLSAPWVTPGQEAVGKNLTEYLRSPDIQRQAIGEGFRPVVENLRASLDDFISKQPFGTAGFKLDPLPRVDRPVQSSDIDDLLFQWDKFFVPHNNRKN